MHTNGGSSFDNRMSLTFQSVFLQIRVDSSSHFPFRVWTARHTFTHVTDQPTQASATATVSNDDIWHSLQCFDTVGW